MNNNLLFVQILPIIFNYHYHHYNKFPVSQRISKIETKKTGSNKQNIYFARALQFN